VVWETRVWANFWGIASGTHAMYVAVTELGVRVVVFGAAATGFHVEAFNSVDGANVFRFASTY
jgi:hypothetical protein